MKPIALLLVGAILLAGCATLKPSVSPKVTQAKDLQNWTIHGAIAVKTAQDGGQATFRWQQQGQQYTFELFGPLGIKHIRVAGNLSEHPPEQELEKRAGWAVPVSHLLYWIRGLPVPEISAQRDWKVEYLAYGQVHGLLLPTRLRISHPTLQVNLLVREWSL